MESWMRWVVAPKLKRIRPKSRQRCTAQELSIGSVLFRGGSGERSISGLAYFWLQSGTASADAQEFKAMVCVRVARGGAGDKHGDVSWQLIFTKPIPREVLPVFRIFG